MTLSGCIVIDALPHFSVINRIACSSNGILVSPEIATFFFYLYWSLHNTTRFQTDSATYNLLTSIFGCTWLDHVISLFPALYWTLGRRLVTFRDALTETKRAGMRKRKRSRGRINLNLIFISHLLTCILMNRVERCQRLTTCRERIKGSPVLSFRYAQKHLPEWGRVASR